MTTNEAAKIAGCSPSTVKLLISENKIVAKKVSIGGARFIYDISLAQANKIKSVLPASNRGRPRGGKNKESSNG